MILCLRHIRNDGRWHGDLFQEMIGAVAKDLGREIKVYISPAAIQSAEPTGSSVRPGGGTACLF